jgi:NADH-quinone oxidoreductase subunit E
MEESFDTILSSYEGKVAELIPLLQRVQQEFGYLPEQAMLKLAKFTHVPESRIYAVASFYAQFRFTPMGRNMVTVCRGTACHVRGAQRILEEVEQRLGIKAGETTEDLEYTLETAACIGCSSLSPTIVINETTHGKLTPAKTVKILSKREESTK